jgi:hypothetical protein
MSFDNCCNLQISLDLCLCSPLTALVSYFAAAAENRCTVVQVTHWCVAWPSWLCNRSVAVTSRPKSRDKAASSTVNVISKAQPYYTYLNHYTVYNWELYLTVNWAKSQRCSQKVGCGLAQPTGQHVQEPCAFHRTTLSKDLGEREDVIMRQTQRFDLGELLLGAGVRVLQRNATVETS